MALRQKSPRYLEFALIIGYNIYASIRDGMSHIEAYICAADKKAPFLHGRNNRLDSGMEIEIKYYKFVIFIMRNAAWFGRLRQKEVRYENRM